MEAILGTSIGVYIGLTLVLMGFAAYMTGQALAVTWKPLIHLIVYLLILGLADRFLTFAMFNGELLSLTGYLWDTGTLLLIGILSYRANRAAKMVSQYPWLYERSSLITWRSRGGRTGT